VKNNKKIELDIDFIGGQEPLTKAEGEALNQYFLHKKQTETKSPVFKKRSAAKRVKSVA